MAAVVSHEIVPQMTSSKDFIHIPPMELRIRDFERESRKLISQELHCTTLAKYCRMNRIPRELRSQLRPTLFNEDESYCKRFENILNRSSFDLMLLTIDYLQKSNKKTREKISTIELNLSSCLPEEECKALKAKVDKVLTEFRKEMEIKKKENFLRDMEDYQLKRVYRWQDPLLDNCGRTVYASHFAQDKNSGNECGCHGGNKETSHQSRSPATMRASSRHRQFNTHPNSLPDKSATVSCTQRGGDPWMNSNCGVSGAGMSTWDLNKLTQTPGSSISQSFKKNSDNGRSPGVVLEKSKSCDKLIKQKIPKISEAADISLPISMSQSSICENKGILLYTKSYVHNDNATTALPHHQTRSNKGIRQSHSDPIKGSEKLEQGDHCKTNAKYIRTQKCTQPASGNVCSESAHSARDQMKPVVTYPGKRPCTCVSGSDKTVKQCPNARLDKCRNRSESDSKKMRRSHPSSVDKVPGILTLHSTERGKSGINKHCTSRKKCKKSQVLGSKIAHKHKLRDKYLSSRAEVLFQKVSWKLQECNKCRKKFSVVVIKTGHQKKAEVLRWRVRSYITGQSKRCTKCKKVIQDRRLSSGKTTYSCTKCGKHFLQRALLDLHQKSHIEEKLFVCPLCGKRFVQHSLLLLHQKAHTVNKPYQCMECGNLFFNKSLFTEHLRTHKEAKPFPCADCGKCFADNTTRVIHQRIHTGEKPFSCKDCGKSFSQHSTLVSHQRIHSGEKPYECHVCGKRFRDRSSLASHQRIHNGEKPFKCQECDKRFTQSCNLRRHERLHMGQKPYVCNKCGKSFNESTKLKSHENVHLKKERRGSRSSK